MLQRVLSCTIHPSVNRPGRTHTFVRLIPEPPRGTAIMSELDAETKEVNETEKKGRRER